MRGLIIYEKNDVAPNQAFINYWQESSEKRGVPLELVVLEDIAFGLRNNKPFLQVKGQDTWADFAVMRLRHPLLSHHLENMGIRCFNSALTSEILNDKRRTHDLFRDVAPMMDTAFIDGDMPSPFPFPVVVKGAGGCGGRQVQLCRDEESYRAAIRAYAYHAVVQPLCDTPGRDVRVYMLGTKVVQGMLRMSDEVDFRSNFGLHHKAQTIDVPDEARKIALTVVETLGSALIGVDFIFDHGRMLFNEAEDAVGTRMLYQYTPYDIVSMYMDYILSHLA